MSAHAQPDDETTEQMVLRHMATCAAWHFQKVAEGFEAQRNEYHDASARTAWRWAAQYAERAGLKEEAEAYRKKAEGERG